MIRRFLAATAAVVAALAGAGLTGAVPAGAQSASGVTVTLSGQDPWVRSGSALTLHLHVAGAPPGAALTFTLHDRVISRSAFDQTLSRNGLGPPRQFLRVPVDALPLDTAGDRVAVVPGTWLPAGGVYPLEVDLRSADDDPLGGFVTHAVAVDVGADGRPAVGVPLAVAWVWPIVTVPAYQADDTPDPAVVAELQPSGRLGRQATLLGADPDVPVTLAPAGETLDGWSALGAKNPELAAGIDSLRAAATHDEVLGGPFVPLDLPALLAGGFGGILSAEQARGIAAEESVLGIHVDPSIATPGPLDAPSVRVLQDANVQELVVDGAALTPAGGQFTPARPAKLADTAADGSPGVTVLATDTGLQRFLTGDDPPALRAERLLAALTIVAGEQPSVGRGVAFANPVGWNADPSFVAAVFAGLRTNPLLRPTTVAGLLSSVPAATGTGGKGDPAVRQLAPVTPNATPVPLAVYQEAQHQEVALRALVGATNPHALRGDRALAAAVTRLWENPAGRRRSYALLTVISRAAQLFLSQIQVPPQSTITITSSRAEIPVTIRNRATQSVVVHVKLSSDRLLFPDGAERDVTLAAGRSTTARFTVETRSSGSAPVKVTVTAANGAFTVAPAVRITVKSSFVSGVGLVLTIGAAVFLLVWWGWDIRRRRRGRGTAPRPRPAAAVPAGNPA